MTVKMMVVMTMMMMVLRCYNILSAPPSGTLAKKNRENVGIFPKSGTPPPPPPLLSKNAFMGQIRQDARIRGWGGHPNFGNARILGTFGAPTHPLESHF